MKLLSELTPEIEILLAYAPLKCMFGNNDCAQTSCMVYADDKTSPKTCVVRFGYYLFVGGKVTEECLAYIQNKILTFEIYEKYGVFCFFCPDDTWRSAILKLYINKSIGFEKYSLLTPVISNAAIKYESINGFLNSNINFNKVNDYPAILVDLRESDRSTRAPHPDIVKTIASRYLDGVTSAERVTKGYSTYVYRIHTAGGVCYARFLPENASFAPEVLAHKKMLEAGVSVPKVVAFEHREEHTGLSLMIAAEIPGESVEDKWPENNLRNIMLEAGRQLAFIHSIPVDGFGWVDKNKFDILKGEKPSFNEYFNDYLEDDLQTLMYYDLSDEEKAQIIESIKKAAVLLDIKNAVLVHGDFDISHIFHKDGKFNGFIDFGEIRGNNRLFDLVTFAYNDASPDRIAYRYLIEGYRSAAALSDNDLYAVELMALFIILRFMGKKAETKSRDHFLRIMKTQLNRLNEFNN